MAEVQSIPKKPITSKAAAHVSNPAKKSSPPKKESSGLHENQPNRNTGEAEEIQTLPSVVHSQKNQEREESKNINKADQGSDSTGQSITRSEESSVAPTSTMGSSPPTTNNVNSNATTGTTRSDTSNPVVAEQTPITSVQQLGQEEERKPEESPIKQRATAYKDEEVKAVQALTFDGTSEQAMESFSTAGASAVAASYASLGNAVNQKIGSEKQQVAESAPMLVAGNTGVKDPAELHAQDPGTGKEVSLQAGVTEGDPAPPSLAPHENLGNVPTYIDRGNLEGDKPQEESGGFWSWLTSKFSGLLSSISSSDNGVNTKAGAAPVLNTQGTANPARAANMSTEGKSDIAQEQQATTNAINSNPGRENIQPLYFEEEKPVVVETTVNAQAITADDTNMQAFTNLPLPESVRKQADQDMAASMEKSLAKPREDARKASEKRDGDRQKAVEDSQAATEKLNLDAEKQQQETVENSRKSVADEQAKGVKEAQDQMAEFNKEADTEQLKTNTDVQVKIKTSQAEANTTLKQAEVDAEKKKQEGEKEAAAEKQAAEKASKNDSWWGKFKKAVKKAVSWLSEKIGKIFDAIRKAVTFIIDKAKKFALAVIEAGRKWIVDKLDKLGAWLKDKVNKYLKHFPALQKRIIAFIDTTVDGAKRAVNAIADGLKKGVEALADALGKAINFVLTLYETALTAAIQMAGALLTGNFTEALKIAFLATCKVAGIDPKPILDFIERAGETISIIFNDPIAFFKNVATGVGQGINQFVTNIKQHLMNGLIGWLTGALSDIPIKLPTQWDLKGIFSLIMQILGLTYDQLRAKLVKRIGPNGEEVVGKMETAFAFIRDLIVNGPIVLWEKIQDKFTEIKEMAMEKIRMVVSLEVVKAGVKWLLSLLNPASAIVRAVIMLYDFVMFLIERKDQIIAFVSSIFDTVGPLARGDTKTAANSVEASMGKGVPVILSLLASLAGIGGIGKAVQKVLQTIRNPIDKLVDPIIDWLVTQGKALFAKGAAVYEAGKEKVVDLKNRFMNWWSVKTTFKVANGSSHSLFFEGGNTNAKLMVASKKTLYHDFLKEVTIPSNNKAMADAKTNAMKIASLVDLAREESVSGATEADKKKNEEAKAKKIEGLLETLRTHTITLFGVDGNSQSENPEYTQGTTYALGTTIKKLTRILPPNGSGTEPTKAKHASYDLIDKRRTGDKDASYYIRGHLLNHNLHGKGEWQNMVPLSRTGNSNHEKQVESKVKAAVDAGAVVYYSVTPNPKAWPNEATLIQQFKAKDSGPIAEVKEKIVIGERDVPGSLSCTAKTVDGSPTVWNIGTIPVDNPVERTYESYIVNGEGVKSVVINLNTGSAADLAKLPHVGDVIAKDILKYREEEKKKLLVAGSTKNVFTSVDDLKNISGIGPVAIKKINDDIGAGTIKVEF